MKTHAKRLPMSLLPAVPGLRLTQVDLAADTVTFTVSSTQTPVPCALCGTPTSRLHSHYERTVTDLP